MTNHTEEARAHGWIDRPDGRGTIDIIWSCLVTVFLCSWSSLFLNVPEARRSKQHFFQNKVKWVILVIFFPEVLIGLAAVQWRSARQSVEDFARLGKRWETMVSGQCHQSSPDDELSRSKINLARFQLSPWTMRHALFVDMGGFLLDCPDYTPFPVSGHQLVRLVEGNHLEYPNVRERAIWDRNKADGFARFLTLVQISWFSVQCFGRIAEHLALTTLELSTLSFILYTINTFFFWRHKHLDVEEPIVLVCTTRLGSILATAEGGGQRYNQTPLDYLNPPITATSLVAPFWFAFRRIFGRRKGAGSLPVRTFGNTQTTPPRGLTKGDIIYIMIFVASYFGIHLAAWTFVFPTAVERQLWRISTFILIGLTAVYLFAIAMGAMLAPTLAKICFHNHEVTTPMAVAGLLPHWAIILMHLPFIAGYSFARLYIIVESFVSLRTLPASAYDSVQWSYYLPHIS